MRSLAVPSPIYADLIEHLSTTEDEQAAFLFTEPAEIEDSPRVAEMNLVPPEGFDFQSDFHISLTDEMRAHVIMRAHEVGGALVEVHSHLEGSPVSFSYSDLHGFEDWVPHVRWRLQRRPYVALVFAGEDFDALVWSGKDNEPSALQSLDVDGDRSRLPSGVTLERLRRGRA